MIKFFVTTAVVLLVSGVLWPLLARFGLGQLPGDIRFVYKGTPYYFPITSCLLVTVVLTLLAWVFRI